MAIISYYYFNTTSTSTSTSTNTAIDAAPANAGADAADDAAPDAALADRTAPDINDRAIAGGAAAFLDNALASSAAGGPPPPPPLPPVSFEPFCSRWRRAVDRSFKYVILWSRVSTDNPLYGSNFRLIQQSRYPGQSLLLGTGGFLGVVGMAYPAVSVYGALATINLVALIANAPRILYKLE